jgi:transposase
MTRYEQVQALKAQGLNPTAISRQLGISRGIVLRHLPEKVTLPKREISMAEVNRRLDALVERLEAEAE